MKGSSIPKSLVRTASSGEMNVFIVLEAKSTNELRVVARDELPPALRLGKLVLNQKIIVRDENRQNVESSIVFMHQDRQVCMNAKNEIIQKRKLPQVDESLDQRTEADNSNLSQNLHKNNSEMNKRTQKSLSKKSQSKSNKKTASTEEQVSTQLPTVAPPPDHPSSHVIDGDIDFFSNYNTNDVTNVNENNEIDTSLIQPSEDDDNDFLLREIRKLTVKINYQAQVIKDRDAEIKRLKLTTITMPADEAAREYIIYLANRIRHGSTAFKYGGSLTADAKRLGLKLEQVEEILKAKNSIASTARDLFKKMIPENQRTVNHWNQLTNDVLVKEKILLDFLERYYGPLEVDQKKVHTSLVGCLRNQRGTQKKDKEKAFLIVSTGSIDESYGID